MRHDVDLVLHLGLLDQLAIRPHTLLRVGLGKDVGDQRRGVEAGEGDELPTVAELGEAIDVRLLLVARHGRLPVERGGEVVRESGEIRSIPYVRGGEGGWDDNVLLLGPHGMHAVGELLGLLVIRLRALHPDHVCVGGKSDGPVDGTSTSALISVVPFSRPCRVPVPVDLDARQAFRDGSGLGVTLAFHRGQVLSDKTFLVDVDAGVDGIDDSVVEEFEAGLSGPLIVNRLKSLAVLPGLLGCDHEIVEWLEGGVRGSEDEGVVPLVDRRHDQSGGFGIRPRDGK